MNVVTLGLVPLLILLFHIPGFASVLWAAGGKGRPPAPVVVEEIRQKDVRSKVTLMGDLEAYTEGDVHTEVRGMVEEFPGREGRHVKQGDVLAKLDSTQLNLELERMRHDLEQSRVILEKEDQEHDRFKNLSKSKSISVQSLKKEWSEAESARFRQRMLEASVRQLEDRAQKKTIRAPFNGYVVKEYVHKGAWLKVGDAVVRMVKVDPIFVRVPFPQKDLWKIKEGDRVDVRVVGHEGQVLRGKLSSIISRGDTASRTFPVKILLDNKGHNLKPGMLAYVTFPLGKAKSLLLVPKDAVVTTPDQKRKVFVVRDGRAVPTPVELGKTSGSLVEIRAKGLKPGQSVVTVGNERLRPGQPVRVIGTGGEKKKTTIPKKASAVSRSPSADRGVSR